MFDLVINQVFLLPWLLIFYGIIYLFGRFIPKGFIIVQLFFVLIWRLLPYYDIDHLGDLPYKDIAVFWIISSLMFLSLKRKK